ncbi:predicted protein [Nematostella vectensis]|uniref:Gamma-aminobutyric acid receptor subunit beta n=1 Tax=Nematostella vectensis TaxID=45351 RepID=A7SFG6_NEMVE|nr:predicted protein [Nematostella vectensis]|eukprot:XP_001629618.1 predicted protein [Nematostella vectensis]
MNESEMTSLLDNLIQGYDPRLRPDFGGDPVTVTVGFWVLSIDAINVIDMDYRMDFFLRQLWRDPRLKHRFDDTLALSNTMLDKIWVPDTYFVNSKMSKFHSVTTINKMLSISPDGLVHYNSRVTVKASCAMNLRMFPKDVQNCNIDIESYGYSADNVQYQWENRSDNGIAVNKKIRDMPQYNLSDINVSRHFTMYVAGNWSGLTATFRFRRRSGYFIIHIYAPCALIVILSWISFCIPPESTAARIALGITSVLTITTILNMLNNSMPKVSYVKAVDWYLIGCFLFVFAVLLEYTFVLYIDNEEVTEYKKDLVNYSSESVKHRSPAHAMNGSIPNGYSPAVFSEHGKKCGHNCHHAHHDVVLKREKHKSSYEQLGGCRPRLKFPAVIDTECIDEFARVLFPFIFIAFNVIYFIVFFFIDWEEKT